MKRKIESIYLHCSATTDGTVEAIRKYHIEHNGWTDIGYHFIIYRDGSIHKGREEDAVGAHVKGDNSHSLGICLIGIDQFTDAQMKSCLDLVTQLSAKYKVKTLNIRGHKEFWIDQGLPAKKNCPGFDVSLLRTKIDSLA